MKKIFLNLIVLFCGMTAIMFPGCDAEENDSQEDTVNSIAITSPPLKEKYYISDTELDTTGLIVTANYRSGRSETIPNEKLKFEGFDDDKGKLLSQKTIKVLYGEGNNLRYTTFSIAFKDLASITILNTPAKIKYNQGDSFDISGMMVSATYLDNTTSLLSLDNFVEIGKEFNVSADGSAKMTITGFDSSSGSSSQTIKVTYTEKDGETLNERAATFGITYTDLGSIAITRQPDKIKYHHGEDFEINGLIVTATYMDNSNAAIYLGRFSKIDEEFNVSSDGKAKMKISGFDSSKAVSSQTITITYSETTNSKEIIRSAQFAVSYVDLANIQITKQPSKLNYIMKEFLQSSSNSASDISKMTLDTDGLEVTATYLDNNTSVIDNSKLTFSGFDPLSLFENNLTSQQITISYTDSSVTRNASFTVNFQWGATYQWHETPVNVTSETNDYYFGDFPFSQKSDDNIKINQYMNMTRGGLVFYLGSDGNYYVRKEDNYTTVFHYYKVEPIKWHKGDKVDCSYVLTSEYPLVSGIPYYTGKTDREVSEDKTVICDDNSYYYYIEKTIWKVKPFSFRYSTIRNYLNGSHENGDASYDGKGFLQSAFTENAQSLIANRSVGEWINKSYTRNYYKKDGSIDSDKSQSGSGPGQSYYTCKVWLLSGCVNGTIYASYQNGAYKASEDGAFDTASFVDKAEPAEYPPYCYSVSGSNFQLMLAADYGSSANNSNIFLWDAETHLKSDLMSDVTAACNGIVPCIMVTVSAFN